MFVPRSSFIHGLAGNPLNSLAKRDKLPLYRDVSAPGQQKTYIYGPDGPLIADDIATRLGFNSTRTMFSTSKTYAQDRENAIPASTDSLATYILDEKHSTLFDSLKSETEREYARAMSRAWDGWIGADLDDTSLRYWQSDVTYSGPDAMIIQGYRGIYNPLAEEVSQSKGSEIRLNEEVIAITLSEDTESVHIQTKSTESGGQEKETKPQVFSYHAPYCVCTIPLGVLQRRSPMFTPALPKRRLNAIARLGMGVLNKVIITYSTCFWPAKQSFTLLPSSISAAFMPLLAHRALWAHNYLPITGKNTLVFYFGATAGKELEQKTDEQVKHGIHAILRHHFANDKEDFPDQPENVLVTRWHQDPYSCGSYSYIKPAKEGEKDVPTPYDFSELGRPQWDQRLFFAGEATDPDHYVSPGHSSGCACERWRMR